MTQNLYETIRGIETAKLRCQELKTDIKILSEKLGDFDNQLKISLKKMHEPDRSQAKVLLLETNVDAASWGRKIEEIISMLDSRIRELKTREKMQMSDDYNEQQQEATLPE